MPHARQVAAGTKSMVRVRIVMVWDKAGAMAQVARTKPVMAGVGRMRAVSVRMLGVSVRMPAMPVVAADVNAEAANVDS
jgi:hypothetical protein